MKTYKRVADYILKEKIGEGNFSTVFLAIKEDDNSKNPRKFAIKCLDKELINNNHILKGLLASEATIMKEISHKNIVHCHEFYETKNNFYLVLDYCDKGDLETHMKKLRVKYLKENEAIQVMKQILKGFQVLRKYDIVHRDLKLSNIFFHEDRIKIGDFGMAKIGKQINGVALGTPLTMAPECMEGKCNDVSKSDLWSLGIIFYKLLFGELPFFGLSLNELNQVITKQSGSNLKIPQSPQISQSTKTLLINMLEKDPVKRITWSEIFSHPLFNLSKKTRIDNSEKATSSNKEIVQEKQTLTQLILKKLPQEKEMESSNYLKEVSIDQVIQKMQQQDKVQEYYYRYCHELNIINFQMRTAQELIDKLNEKFNICETILALIEMANKKCHQMKNQLLRRENIFDLKDFLAFSSSVQYEDLIDNFSDKLKQIQNFRLNFQRNSLNNIDQRIIKTISLKNENELINILKKGLEIIKNISPQIDQSILLIGVKVTLNFQIDEVFQFWRGTQKFDWKTLDRNYQNLSYQSLQEIIDYSLEQLINFQTII